MPESWHPKKTEKDVAVARAGVAKYDRGWKYGAGTRKHDHSKPGKGGEVLSPEQINNVYVVDPGVSDIGAAIQDIHDNKCNNFDAIFIPPGEYTQSTKITLSKWVALFSTGDWHNPGAIISKATDIIQLETTTTDRPTGYGRGDGGHTIRGVRFTGKDVADTSTGINIHSIVDLDIQVDNHGSHGIFFETADDANHVTNWSQGRIHTHSNGGDGVRMESTGGTLIDLNAMNLELRSSNNAGNGLNALNGKENRFQGDCSSNGAAGWVIDGTRHICKLYMENNTNPSSLPATYSEFHLQCPPSRVDLTSIDWSSTFHYGKQDFVSRVTLGTDQTIPTDTITTVNWDTIDIEQPAVIDADLTNNQITVKAPGRYLINGQIRWGTGFAAGDTIQLRIDKNGGLAGRTTKPHTGSAVMTCQRIQANLGLSAGDVITLSVYQNSGGEPGH